MAKHPRSLMQRLLPRHLSILDDIESYRLMTTRQVQRLYFPVGPDGHSTQVAASKSCLRLLHKLEDYGVIKRIQGRIGGLHAGSAGYVWHLTTTGDWIQRHRTGRSKRHRYNEPSQQFLRHRVAVGDVAISLRELQRNGHIQITHLQHEPEAWRDFLGPHGQPVTLKPDLFCAYRIGDWEEYQFIEVDLGTENLQKIARKIETYLQHLNTGTEARRYGVHPAVVWLATDTRRKTALEAALAAHEGLPAGFMRVDLASLFADSILRASQGQMPQPP